MCPPHLRGQTAGGPVAAPGLSAIVSPLQHPLLPAPVPGPDRDDALDLWAAVRERSGRRCSRTVCALEVPWPMWWVSCRVRRTPDKTRGPAFPASLIDHEPGHARAHRYRLAQVDGERVRGRVRHRRPDVDVGPV